MKNSELVVREEWADIAKFIAIFLMVWAHIGIEYDIRLFIHIFHMPIFFFLSGYFEKDKNKPLLHSLLKNMRTLLKPYFFFSIFAISYCWIYPYRHPELYPGIDSATDFFIAIIKGLLIMDDSVSFRYFMPNFPLWFLAALFIVRFLFSILNRFIYNLKYKDLLWVTVIVLSLAIFPYFVNIRYYSLDSAIMGMGFYVSGFLFHKYNCLRFVKRNVGWLPVFSFLFLLIFGYKNGMIDMNAGLYGHNIAVFYMNAIIGILMVISLSIIISSKRLTYFAMLGRNSIIILGTHVMLILGLKFVFASLGIPLMFFSTFLMTVLVMFFSIPIIRIIHNRISFILN